MGLYTAAQHDEYSRLSWERDALQIFHQKMTDKEYLFPCIPATQGHSLDHFRYGFVGDPRKNSTVNEFAKLLKEYTEKSKQIGKYTSLIVFFETPIELSQEYDVEQFEQIFWQLLSDISSIDEKEWPKNIPVDPHNPIWEYCFHHEQYFMYCATPAHKNRNSRHFPYFMMAITPRWVLEQFNENKSFAAKIKENIRKRIVAYDSVPIHPDLNTYGKEDNYEWKQYFLHDDESSLSKCPYHRFLKLIGKEKK
ncbi:YqcI/YcgG family protein [Bacillus suaedaesalsae]|uniref:YqcI/YcgG family protein n=1 Tax=Bacillus suaedaesalsae TaxID=2810349 RepID=A0ABS2DHG4_9BACI|nr:YqcI/YcgG family protein [Bacillus suaedaesalsae]MBM6617934.1 YqcI/YcgG family protein [Bacillus suaedaesalsae]